MTKDDYCHYFQSSHWHTTAEAKLAKAGYRCERTFPTLDGKRDRRCTNTKRLQVHYRDCDSIGKEQTEDMMVLCERCHFLEHVHIPECERCGGDVLSLEEDLADLIDVWRRDNPDSTVDDFDLSWLHHYPLCEYCDHIETKGD
jgi:hypothetical protein